MARLAPTFLTLFALLLAPQTVTAADVPSAAELASKTSAFHGLSAWRGKQDIAAHMTVVFGGKTIINHEFIFEANNAKARMTDANGNTTLYDGKDAWAIPSAEANPRGRFHVLTWPWFLRAPLTLQEQWQQLGPVSSHQLNEQSTWLTRQTFAADTGDTPDDWYDLVVDPATGRLEGMYYIVTYGKTMEEANKSVSLIEYHDYQNVDGVELSFSWTLWKVDATTRAKIGEPKATVTVKDVRFVPSDAQRYAAPANAERLPLE